MSLAWLHSTSSAAAAGGPGELSWEEIIDARGRRFEGDAPMYAGPADAGLFTDTTVKDIDPDFEKRTETVDEAIVRWSKALRIQKPRDYENGVYGKVGTATVYISHTSRVPDFDRLHWVMVKVLSEKYGCFIVQKLSTEQNVSIRCRDKRRIVFRRSKGTDWVMFYGRQYDHRGNEVIIGH